MINEDYCSFEVAKLLKEKGFNEPCRAVYEEEILRINTLCDYYNSELSSYVCAPTHQMAMRWLREAHNIDICVFPCYYDYITWGYYCKIFKDKEEFCSSEKFRTFEEALDMALLFVLQNMIF